MGKIQELPKLDRPREKALRYGLDKLSDAELLAIIVGSGFHGENVNELANRLLSTYNGLIGLSKTPVEKLKKIKGIKESKALLISALFEVHNRLLVKEKEIEEVVIDSDFLYQKYRQILKDEKQEVLFLVIVDRRDRCIYECMLYKGTETNVIFSYKDMWRELYIHQAYAFYLIHNHPRQDAIPSVKDKIFTDEINNECNRIKIPLLDHIIIGADGYFSFKKMKICYISC